MICYFSTTAQRPLQGNKNKKTVQSLKKKKNTQWETRCTSVCTCACTHTRMHVWTHTHRQTHRHTQTRTHAHTHTYLRNVNSLTVFVYQNAFRNLLNSGVLTILCLWIYQPWWVEFTLSLSDHLFVLSVHLFVLSVHLFMWLYLCAYTHSCTLCVCACGVYFSLGCDHFFVPFPPQFTSVCNCAWCYYFLDAVIYLVFISHLSLTFPAVRFFGSRRGRLWRQCGLLSEVFLCKITSLHLKVNPSEIFTDKLTSLKSSSVN